MADEMFARACAAASGLYRIEMFPFFAFVHFLLVAATLRRRPGAFQFAVHHPVTSCMVSVVSSLSGSIIIYSLLAQPVFQVFAKWQVAALSTFAWYLVFFSPLDFCFTFLDTKVGRIVSIVLKEVHRTRMIFDGVHLGLKYYPESCLIIVLFGCIKGSGAKFLLRPLDCISRGLSLQDHEFLVPHFTTKSSVAISVAVYLVHIGRIPSINEGTLFLIVYIYLTAFQLSLFMTKLKDPYAYIQNILWHVFIVMPNSVARNVKSKTD